MHSLVRLVGALGQQKVDPRDRRCHIANRAMRRVHQLVGGRQVWRGRGVDREYLLANSLNAAMWRTGKSTGVEASGRLEVILVILRETCIGGGGGSQ